MTFDTHTQSCKLKRIDSEMDTSSEVAKFIVMCNNNHILLGIDCKYAPYMCMSWYNDLDHFYILPLS